MGGWDWRAQSAGAAPPPTHTHAHRHAHTCRPPSHRGARPHLVLPKTDDRHQLGARLQRDAGKALALLEDLDPGFRGWGLGCDGQWGLGCTGGMCLGDLLSRRMRHAVRRTRTPAHARAPRARDPHAQLHTSARTPPPPPRTHTRTHARPPPPHTHTRKPTRSIVPGAQCRLSCAPPTASMIDEPDPLPSSRKHDSCDASATPTDSRNSRMRGRRKFTSSVIGCTSMPGVTGAGDGARGPAGVWPGGS